MCGIGGVITRAGLSPSLTDDQAARWRDLMARRGPDACGLWRRRNALLVHRRLSILDPTDAGAQPMLLSDDSRHLGTGVLHPRFALVYNGELYNDAELRAELGARGVRFRTACDTETVLHALAHWGTQALARFRGMYALAFHDTLLNTLLLARDPLGIKPLYFHVDERQLVFASEPHVVAAHPEVPCRPNLAMAAAYLTTIRTVLGNDTLYEGVSTLRPGQVALCEFGGGHPVVALQNAPRAKWGGQGGRGAEISAGDAEELVCTAVTDSVRRHLRADVPTCCLLSGGLDSSIVTSIAVRGTANLRTYCAGAPLPTHCRDDESTSDLWHARMAAAHFGTRHGEAHVTHETFTERWAWMVGEMGVPLSTPNEVAIWGVADRLRADGCPVTLSGEGADELFAGYEAPMRTAWSCARAVDAGRSLSPGLVELNEASWVPASAWAAVIDPGVLESIGGPGPMQRWYEEEFARAVADTDGEYSVQSHLRFHQRINLAGLLQRLDSATMLAGVEGRTPLADVALLELANALPVESKCRVERAVMAGAGVSGGGIETGDEPLAPVRTKIVLREAFAGDLPARIVERPKASFPLPFQGWMGEHAASLRTSGFARSVFTDAARALVAERPEEAWRFAWPMANLALWGRRF